MLIPCYCNLPWLMEVHILHPTFERECSAINWWPLALEHLGYAAGQWAEAQHTRNPPMGLNFNNRAKNSGPEFLKIVVKKINKKRLIPSYCKHLTAVTFHMGPGSAMDWRLVQGAPTLARWPLEIGTSNPQCFFMALACDQRIRSLAIV